MQGSSRETSKNSASFLLLRRLSTDSCTEIGDVGDAQGGQPLDYLQKTQRSPLSAAVRASEIACPVFHFIVATTVYLFCPSR